MNNNGDIEDVTDEYLKEQYFIFKREMECRGFDTTTQEETGVKCNHRPKDMDDDGRQRCQFCNKVLTESEL